MTYLQSLELNDSLLKVKTSPELAIEFRIGLDKRVFPCRNVDCYTVRYVGLTPSGVYYPTSRGEVFGLGRFDSFEECLSEFFSAVVSLVDSFGSPSYVLQVNKFAFMLVPFRKKWIVKCECPDFTRCRFSVEFSDFSSNRVFYKGDYITAFVHYKGYLKEFIANVM